MANPNYMHILYILACEKGKSRSGLIDEIIRNYIEDNKHEIIEKTEPEQIEGQVRL